MHTLLDVFLIETCSGGVKTVAFIWLHEEKQAHASYFSLGDPPAIRHVFVGAGVFTCKILAFYKFN